jgi:hypothetical protein
VVPPNDPQGGYPGCRSGTSGARAGSCCGPHRLMFGFSDEGPRHRTSTDEKQTYPTLAVGTAIALTAYVSRRPEVSSFGTPCGAARGYRVVGSVAAMVDPPGRRRRRTQPRWSQAEPFAQRRDCTRRRSCSGRGACVRVSTVVKPWRGRAKRDRRR